MFGGDWALSDPDKLCNWLVCYKVCERRNEGAPTPELRSGRIDGGYAPNSQKKLSKLNEKFLYCFKTSIIMFRTAKFTLFQGWGKNAAVLETPVGL